LNKLQFSNGQEVEENDQSVDIHFEQSFSDLGNIIIIELDFFLLGQKFNY